MRILLLFAVLAFGVLDMRTSAAGAVDVRAVSVIAPGVPRGDTPAGNSGAGTFSGDGKSVLFLSSAPNLVTNDHNGTLLDLFRRDLGTRKTTLVSVRSDGRESGNGQTTGFSVSSDGRFVAFSSLASDLVPGDTNGASDIFVRDLQTGSTRLVSATSSGGPAYGDSAAPEISGDGKFVLFESAAPDLAVGDTNRGTDVFLRELATGATSLVSSRADGTPGNQSSTVVLLSADAEVIVFRSDASDLVPPETGKNTTDLFVRRRSTGVTTRFVLPGVPAVPAALPVRTYNHVMSQDGRYLAFRAQSGSGASLAAYEGVWWCDLMQGTLVRASGDRFVDAGDDDATGPAMSSDGRRLAFEAQTSRTGVTRVVVWDVEAGSRTLDQLVATVPPVPAAPEPSTSYQPVLSPDGSRLAFLTDAAVPTAGVPDEGDFLLYVRTLATGAMKTPDVDESGAFDYPAPEFSPDGGSLLFQSTAAFAGTDDRNEATDIFVASADLQQIELVTPRAEELPQVTSDGFVSSVSGSLSDDGRFLVYTSTAGDVVPDDGNGTADVFVFDAKTGSNALVTKGTDGAVGSNFSGGARISGDGRYIVFSSSATNLVAGDTNGVADVFVRDLVAGTTTLASAKDRTSTGGSGASGNATISADGRYVAFESRAADLVPGILPGANVFLRDRTEGRTYLLSADALLSGGLVPGRSSTPVVSADGRVVAFYGNNLLLPDLFIYSVPSNQLSRATSGQRLVGFSLSRDGGRAAYAGSVAGQPLVQGVFWRDVVAGTNRAIATSSGPLRNFGDVNISGDGRRIAFTSNFVPEGSIDTNGVNDVFVHDIATGVLTRVSSAIGGGVADGPSGAPMLTADGRRVVFQSAASNLVADDTNLASDVFVRDLDTGETILVSRRPGDGRSGRGGSNRPSLSADGRTVAFLSAADDLVAGDFNFEADLFLASLPGPAVTDSDSDGLPDVYERAVFGDLGRTGDGDFDGDGATDRDEFVSGTEPKDPRSVLRLDIGGSDAVGSVVLTWRTAMGIAYQVQRGVPGSGSWEDVGALVVGDAAMAQVKASPGADAVLFRLVVRLR